MELSIKELPSKQTLCLNMIVKDESHVILTTLEKLCSYFSFDYWVICDTGSSDNTKELIKDFFEKKFIPGELIEHQWQDFAYNRTKALECAYNKTDYLLIFDADDDIHGELVLPSHLSDDMYKLIFGPGFEYERGLLISNKKKWQFKGVLHEFLTCCEPIRSETTIRGDYYIISGKSGNRSKNPNKYYDDAQILEKGFEKEMNSPNGDKGLAHRYAFYCGQSYKDAGPKYVDDSIKWYSKVLDLNNWIQEKYYACYQLGYLYKSKNDYVNALKYWIKTFEYDSERIEGIACACEYYYNNGMHLLVNSLYERCKNYSKKPYNKLFVTQHYYNDVVEYYNSISAFYNNNKESGYDSCKRIIINNICDQNKINSTFSNILFYKDLIEKDKSENLLVLFYGIDNAISKIASEDKEPEQKYYDLWNLLFNKVRHLLTNYNNEVATKLINIKYNNVKPNNMKSNNIKTIITFTTCKRFDLFEQTVNSIMNHWTDIDKIDYWFCVDDNSNEEDRQKMREKYSWINFYMKTPEEKGHRASMNIIYNKLKEIFQENDEFKYWIHHEDDFLYHHKQDYVGNSIEILNELNNNASFLNIKQILFNKNYGETIENYGTKGGIKIFGTKYNLIMHEYKQGTFNYPNCHYWPHYSFRPSMIYVKAILDLGNFDSPNQFFEMDYAQKWTNNGYKSVFYNAITNRHIGRLTSERNNSSKKNAYELNNENQFTHNNDDNNVNNTNNENENEKILNNTKEKLDIDVHIINLERRKDRLEYLLETVPFQFKRFNAIDGKNLSSYLNNTIIKDLILSKQNKECVLGELGCSLSHYLLWNKIKDNNLTLIMEDDVIFNNDSLEKIKETLININNLSNSESDIKFEFDVFYIGGQWTPNYGINSTCYIDKHKILPENVSLNNDSSSIICSSNTEYIHIKNNIYKRLNNNNNYWNNSFFRTAGAYILSKSGVNKLIHLVKNNVEMFINTPLDVWLIKNESKNLLNNIEVFNHIIYQGGFDLVNDNRLLNNDIKRDMKEILKINKNQQVQENNIEDFFSFIPHLDQIGNDLYYNKKTLNEMLLQAYLDKNCVGVNSLGFFKNKIDNLTSSKYFGINDGIYIKKTNLLKENNNIDKNSSLIQMPVNHNTPNCDKIRIKMIGNYWNNSKELCDEFNLMRPDNSNIILVDDVLTNNDVLTNKEVDYYVIINKPPNDSVYYDPSKTLVFQMEPKALESEYGTHSWGKWANPDKNNFFYVHDYENENNLNIAQWRFRLEDIKLNSERLNKIASVVSYKNYFKGHKLRNEFLSYLETDNNNLNDVYGKQNYHNLKHYVGPITDDNIENVLTKYKYYFMPENNYENNYATEKIWEPLLCECLCFYWGCPNLENYIDERAFVRLPLDNFEESIQIIKRALEEDWWSQRIEIIRKEKEKIINNYGFFSKINNIIINRSSEINKIMLNRFKVVILTLKDYNKPRLEKLNSLLNQFTNYGIIFELFYGVNGKHINIQDTDKSNIKLLKYENLEDCYYDRNARISKQLMISGELGASWGHLNIYKQLVNDTNFDNYLILEDDAELIVNMEILCSYLQNIPKDYDICHIAMSDWYPFMIKEKVNSLYYIPVRRYFSRATAYIISKNGANKCIKYANNYINVPPDDLLSNMYMDDYENMRLYIPRNYLFHERKNTVSIVNTIFK